MSALRRIAILGLSVGWWATSVSAASWQVSTDKKEYKRYELVNIIAQLGSTPSASSALPITAVRASVWRKGVRVHSVDDKPTAMELQQQDNGSWQAHWAIPFNPTLGEYRVEVQVSSAGDTLLASTPFQIQGRKPHPLPPGFCVVTYEGGKKGIHQTAGVRPEDPEGWPNLVHWANTMGADALWQCIGQTQVWGNLKTDQFPWSTYSLRLMPKVGELAHSTGLQYGAWITAFVVIGDKPEASGYQFTLGYSREQNALRQLRYVSLGCEKRIQDLVQILQMFDQCPQVDYIGLDYMRTDFGGYEFASEFVRDMDITPPPEWPRWSSNERSLWLARLLEVQRDEVARRRWEWWRAHRVALVVDELVRTVKPKKPLWVFSLGWKGGHQHGQDVQMMLDAGVDFNAPMFYSIDKPNFPEMLRFWQSYQRQSPTSIVIGQCVDWNLLGKTLNPASPQEHLQRQLDSMQALVPVAKHMGFFWHDLARALFGARGPYGSMEWAMAGAVSFSRLKTKAGRISYQLLLRTPVEAVLHRETTLPVEIVNLSANTLSAVSVEGIPLPRMQWLDPSPRVIRDVAPGENPQVVNLRLRVDQVYAPNGQWQMLAVKTTCPDDGPRNSGFELAYVPVTTELGPPLPANPAATPQEVEGAKGQTGSAASGPRRNPSQ